MAEIEIPNVEELEEIKEKRFTKRVALVTAMFAVMLAITSLGGNNAMKEMLLTAQEASNQWAYYQAKGDARTPLPGPKRCSRGPDGGERHYDESRCQGAI